MIKFINKRSLKDLILGRFSALTFTSRSVRLNSEKLPRLTISKIDVELPVSVATIYFYDGKRFYCFSDLWDYVHKQYPQSKYNVLLKF